MYACQGKSAALLTKGNYRWEDLGFYKASIRYIDLLYGSYNGNYPPGIVLDLTESLLSNKDMYIGVGRVRNP